MGLLHKTITDISHCDHVSCIAEPRLLLPTDSRFGLNVNRQCAVGIPKHPEVFLRPTALRLRHTLVEHICIDSRITPPTEPILICAEGRLQGEVVCVKAGIAVPRIS